MAMSTRVTAPSLPFWLGPIGWVGKSVIGVLSYLGGVAALMISAAVSLITFPRDDDLPGFWTVLKEELWWLLLMGAPLVGLVHVAMGLFRKHFPRRHGCGGWRGSAAEPGHAHDRANALGLDGLPSDPWTPGTGPGPGGEHGPGDGYPFSRRF